MQKGRGGMGSTKHGKSGTPGPNRRELQGRARFVNKMNEKAKRPKSETFSTIAELMEKGKAK